MKEQTTYKGFECENCGNDLYTKNKDGKYVCTDCGNEHREKTKG